MPPTKKYSLTEEHRAELKPWADKWIANALSTKPMDAEERAICAKAAVGLYASAGLPAPRVVFVPSPFVLRFAGGFAAAIWHGHKVTATSLATRAATSLATDDATRLATYDATNDATDDATDDATRLATSLATRLATNDATRLATDDATRLATSLATRLATDDATRLATSLATRLATSLATRLATNDATRLATDDATRLATSLATRLATDDATRLATSLATRLATDDATRLATNDATRLATDDATRLATNDATRLATDDATRLATDDANWYMAPGDWTLIAKRCAGPRWKLGLSCAQMAWRMWQGGNQWSAWSSYLSFFRHVAKLPIDYSKWDHWEQLSLHSGPRIVHPEFCMISDRPTVLTVDDRNRPHNAIGPFCTWSDGCSLFAWHGVRVPAKYYLREHSAREILAEPNAEVRRAMMERYDELREKGSFVSDVGARVIDSDVQPMRAGEPDTINELLCIDLPDDPEGRIVAVKVIDPSTGRQYVIRVHPELRPMLGNEKLGSSQKMTVRNAVASTFGMTGEEYCLSQET